MRPGRRWPALLLLMAIVSVAPSCGTRVAAPPTDTALRSGGISSAAPAASPSLPAPAPVAPAGGPTASATPPPVDRPGPARLSATAAGGVAIAPAGRAAPAGVGGGSGERSPSVAQPSPGVGPEPAPPPSTTPGSPGTEPITIGNVGSYSGVIGEPWSKQRDAVRVWVAMTNAAGGVRGAEVRMVSADDGADPARHKALVRELVERRKVIAFVGNAEAITGAASVDYLDQAQVPVVGSEGGGDYFYTSPMHFPQQVHGDRWVYIALAAAAMQGSVRGYHKLGTLVCVEVNVCEQAHQMASAVAGENGMEVVWQQRASLTQPDFTAECLAARRAGVEVLLVGMDPNSVGRVAGSCARQGYNPMFATNGGVASDALLRVPNLEGMAVGSAIYPYTQSDTPAMLQFHQAMRTYAAGSAVDMNHAVGWAAAKLFERAAQGLMGKPTAGQVLEGLWTIKDDDLGGLTYPLTFTRGAPAPRVTCWWNMTIRGGRYDVFRDSRRVCH